MMKFLGKVGQGLTHHGKDEGRHSKKEEDSKKKPTQKGGAPKKKSAGKGDEAGKSSGPSKPGTKKGGKKKGEPSLEKKSRSSGEGRTGKDSITGIERECVTEEILIVKTSTEVIRNASEDENSCSDENSDSPSPQQGLRHGGEDSLKGGLSHSLLVVSGETERALPAHSPGPLLSSGNEKAAKAGLPISETPPTGQVKAETGEGPPQVARSEGSVDTPHLRIDTKGGPPKLPLSQGSQQPTVAAASPDVGGAGAGAGAGQSSFKCPITPGPAPSPSGNSSSLDAPSEELQPALEACRSESVAEQLEGLSRLRGLSKQGKQARQDMVTAGTVETLLRLQNSEDEQVLNLVLLVLLNLSFDDETVQEMGVIIPFAEHSLYHASPTIRESAAAVAFSLSRHEFHRGALLHESVVCPLVGVLASGTEQGKRDSCKALFHLSYLPESYEVLLRAGVVDPAIELLYPPDSKIAEKATCLLANIARCPEGCEAIAESDQGLFSLVEVLNDGSHLGKEFAAAALLLIAQSNAEYRDSLIQESPFIGLGRLQDTGTARAKIKATALLQLIREDKPNGGEEEEDDY